MLKFRYLILLLVLSFANNLSAFEPKVSYAKEQHQLFQEFGKNYHQIYINRPTDALILKMIEISRENIKNLPDELDFGDVQLDGIVNYETINKYRIYNYVFEGMIIDAGVEVSETLQPISLFPIPSKLGKYSENIIFTWEQTDPISEKVKRYKKVIKIKANCVEKLDEVNSESIVGVSLTKNEIKEIWYDNPASNNFEDLEGIVNSGINIIISGTLNIIE